MNFSASSSYGNFSLKLENCVNVETIVIETKQPLVNDITLNVSPQGSKLKVLECNYYTKTRWPQNLNNGNYVYKYVIRCYKPSYGMYLHLITNMDLPLFNMTIYGKKLGSPQYKLLNKIDNSMGEIECDSLIACSKYCSLNKNCTGFTFPNGSLHFGYPTKSINLQNNGLSYYEVECELKLIRTKC